MQLVHASSGKTCLMSSSGGNVHPALVISLQHSRLCPQITHAGPVTPLCSFLGAGMHGERAEDVPADAIESESESQSESKASSLWQLASDKALLHATILRALRFGDQPPPGFQQQVHAANQGKSVADRATRRSSAEPVSRVRVDSPDAEASNSDQVAEAGGVHMSPAIVSTRTVPRSVTRQQAAALLAQQPQALRCGAKPRHCHNLYARAVRPSGWLH